MAPLEVFGVLQLMPLKSLHCYASASPTTQSYTNPASWRRWKCLYLPGALAQETSVAWSLWRGTGCRRSREIENAEYRQRMLVNAVAASFLALMIVTGYWIVNTLVQVS
jgi:hypothetical protein